MIKSVKVGIFVLVALSCFFALYKLLRTTPLNEKTAYTVYAYFDDATGLAKRTRVQVAGIDVGKITDITLENSRAKIIILIRNDLILKQDASIKKTALSILGDYKLDIYAGSQNSPALEDGGEIKHVVSLSATDRIIGELDAIVKSVGQLIADQEGQPSPIRKIVEDVGLAAKSAATTLESFDGAIRGNVDSFNQILKNLNQFSAHLSNFVAGKEDNIEVIITNTKVVSENLRNITDILTGIIGKSEGEFKDSVTSLRDTLEKINTSLADINDITEAVRTEKGTLGKVIYDDTLISDVETSVGTVSSYLKRIDQIQTWVSLRSEFKFSLENTERVYNGVKNYLQVRIHPKIDKYYLIELVDDPRGFRKTTTTDIESTSPENGRDPIYRERTTETTNDLKFSLQMAKRYNWLTLRFGLIENTGGVGANVHLFEDKVECKLDIFEFGLIRNPRVKGLVSLGVLPHIYIHSGVDDVFNRATFDFFLGAGIYFNDEDLKTIISTTGIPSP